jgi:hypothetical protein
MAGLDLSTVELYRGLRVVTLENELLRVQILPEAGAKIWQITYLPLDTELLWNNPHISPAQHAIHAPYDDVWSGGWDELFPNDEEAVIRGKRYPDHGELWSAAWDAESFSFADRVGVTLRLQTPLSSVTVEKTIELRHGSAQLHFSHRFTKCVRLEISAGYQLTISGGRKTGLSASDSCQQTRLTFATSAKSPMRSPTKEPRAHMADSSAT